MIDVYINIDEQPVKKLKLRISKWIPRHFFSFHFFSIIEIDVNRGRRINTWLHLLHILGIGEVKGHE